MPVKSLGGPKSYMQPGYHKRQKKIIEYLRLEMPPHEVLISGNNLDIIVMSGDPTLESKIVKNIPTAEFKNSVLLDEGRPSRYIQDFEGGFKLYISGEKLRIDTGDSRLAKGEFILCADKDYRNSLETARKSGFKKILIHQRTRTVRIVRTNLPTEADQ